MRYKAKREKMRETPRRRRISMSTRYHLINLEQDTKDEE